MGTYNNMPPLASITGGEDWLELSVFADLSARWENQTGDLFVKALQTAKENGEPQPFDLFEQQFKMQLIGTYFGPMRYEYRVFDQLGLVWWFRKDPVDIETIPSVRVRVPGTSFLCTNMCLRGFVHWIERFFQNMRVDVRRMLLSRIDQCIDLPNMSIEVFRYAHMHKHYVTRAKSRAMEESFIRNDEHWRFMESTGLTLYCGRPPLQMRAYEKLAELQHKLDPAKWQAMIDYRWGGIIPERATRVEFELRREALKSRGIDTVDDYLKKRATLANYLCNEWFRYVRPNGGSRKRRWPTLRAWEVVQQGFNHVFIGELNRNMTPVPKQPCDISALAMQSFGLVLKAAQCQGVELKTHNDAIQYCAQLYQVPVIKKLPVIFKENNK